MKEANLYSPAAEPGMTLFSAAQVDDKVASVSEDRRIIDCGFKKL